MEIEKKIEQLRDEINRYCYEHSISEERIMEVANMIKQRNSLIYQTYNEVWYKRKPEDIYFTKQDLKEYALPGLAKVAIHYRPNKEQALFDEIENVFNVNICGIYDYSYTEEVDKEYEEMCQKYNPQDTKFIIWCLRRKYPEKHIEYHCYCGYDQGDYYDCFFMSDKDVDINEEVAIVKDYCKSQFWQYDKEPDEYDGCSHIATIMQSFLPSNDLDNEEEIKEHLKQFSGTDREIIIK